MIKAIHIIGSAGFGGIEKLVYDLSKSQKELPNLEVNLLILDKKGEFIDKFLSSGVKCYFSNIRSGFDLNIIKYIRIYRLLKKFDVANLHSFNPLLSLVVLASKIKVVYTVHSVKGFGRVKKKLSGIKENLQISFMNKVVDFITYNSEYTRDFWSKKITNTNGAVIYNGIDFTSNRTTVSTEKINKPASFVIGTSSRFIKWKRIDLLIRAFAFFHKKHNNAKLLLVGDGPELASLKDEALQLKISEHIIFTGYKTNVKEYQNIMDICVFPSVTETFGLVAIETLALGKPTIVMRDGGGISEIVGKGFPFDVAENEIELIEKMNYYFENQELILEQKEKRIQYSKNFDIKLMAQSFLTIYKDLTVSKEETIHSIT